jgi:hypothetical protein
MVQTLPFSAAPGTDKDADEAGQLLPTPHLVYDEKSNI